MAAAEKVSALSATAVLEHLRGHQQAMLEMLERFINVESPSDDAERVAVMRHALEAELTASGRRCRRVRAVSTGDHLLAMPANRRRHKPLQLVLGHFDTVWPVGEVATRPMPLRAGRWLSGPGSFDMKGGLVQLIFALRCLGEMRLQPPADVVVFANADEEIGSPDSRRWINRLAGLSARTFVLEGAFGPAGNLKVGRKGVGRYLVRVAGVAAHSGLDPEAGASAVLEVAQQIQRLFEMNDPATGTTVNVGMVDGGLRPNVIAPMASAQVEVRATTLAEAANVDAAIRQLTPINPAVSIEVTGGFGRPPMEATKRNLKLWQHAQRIANELGIPLESAVVGGASDGNLTSLLSATLDGLGAVGDGAHRLDERVLIDTLPERAALLTLLLMQPIDDNDRDDGLTHANC